MTSAVEKAFVTLQMGSIKQTYTQAIALWNANRHEFAVINTLQLPGGYQNMYYPNNTMVTCIDKIAGNS